MRRSGAAKTGAAIAIAVGMALLFDWALMHTRYDRHRQFLQDVDHYPSPNGIDTNSDGVRDKREASFFREEDLNIVFLGDSFVWGSGLWPQEALPQQFQRKARERMPGRKINAANFGWPSSSPYLSLRRLKEIGAKYHPDIVILAIDMTDFHDDIKYERYVEKPGAFKLLDFFPGTFFLTKALTQKLEIHEAVFGYPSERFFVVNHPLDQTRKYFAPLQKNIDAIEAHARSQLDAEFVLIIFPRHYQYSEKESPQDWERGLYTRMGPYTQEPFKYFEELKATVNYSVHSLQSAFQRTDVFPTTFFDDPHWSPAGCGIAADAILEILEAEGLLPAPDSGR